MKYTVRTMAAAILTNGGDILLMKRAHSRFLAPGMWSAVGGHVEHGEFDYPEMACRREIEEETGLGPDDIGSLTLRYVLLRMAGTEIRHQYIFVGQTLKRDVGFTEEGDLHWIPSESVLGLDMHPSFRLAMNHYLSESPSDDIDLAEVLVGVIGPSTNNKTTPGVTWVNLEDWEKGSAV